jgi:hypothetical protein
VELVEGGPVGGGERVVGERGGDLVGPEAQLLGPDLRQQALGPPPGHRQVERPATGGQDPHVGRHVLDQHGQPVEHRGVPDGLEVLEDDERGAVVPRDVLELGDALGGQVADVEGDDPVAAGLGELGDRHRLPVAERRLHERERGGGRPVHEVDDPLPADEPHLVVHQSLSVAVKNSL